MNAQFSCLWQNKMHKKASAAIVSLWVLVVLALLVVSISQRVSLALKLSRYHKDRLEAFGLAKAGVNRAIVEILNDETLNYDSLEDKWADNEQTIFNVIDAESKININTAPREMLIELLDRVKVSNSSEIANNICAWRGDIDAASVDAASVDYQDLGYANKAAHFSRSEELILVKGITPEIYNLVKELITAYGTGKININTASSETLEILSGYCARKGADLNFPVDLAVKIIGLRHEGAVFETLDDVKLEFTQGQAEVLNNVADVKSTCFYIRPNGKINIQAVFDRDNKKIIYWHES